MRAAEPRTGSQAESVSPPSPLVRVTILSDEMTVVTKIEAAAPLEAEAIEDALLQAGVRYGLIPEAIEMLSAGAGQREAVVARGEMPQDGVDARFEPLITVRRDIGAPKLQPDGRVDYLDLGYAQAVRIGDPLMRRFPARPGRPGRTVKGDELVAKEGRDRSFRRVGRGTRVSPDDPDLLVAAVSGLPSFGPDYVQVDPILRLPSVDLSTGHIKFAGTVIVVGDVANGLRIEADRDVIVAGTVEAAEIFAGGNIELRGGMVGHGRGIVQAGGSVTARYLDGVHLSAGESLFFEETISHSQVIVANDVIAVSALGRGQIIGGSVQAARGVRVRTLGAPAGTHTAVTVGVDPQRDERRHRAFSRMDHLKTELDDLTRLVVQMRLSAAETGEMAAVIAKREGLIIELEHARDEWERLQHTSFEPADSFIRALDYFYAGVEAGIAELRRTLHDDVPGATLVARGRHIVAKA